MDLAAIPWGALGGIGGTGMASIFFWLMYTGRVLSRSTVDDLLSAQREVNSINKATADTLKSRVDVLTDTNATQAETNRRLTDEYGQTASKALAELQAQARKGADRDG